MAAARLSLSASWLAPSPEVSVGASYRELQPSDGWGAIICAGFASVTALGLALSAWGPAWAWVVGQLVLAVGLVQWFVLLHEAGHATLFKTRWLNDAAGHVASLGCAIPFYPWRSIHALHHRWTGWQDLDPTTSALVPRELKPVERAIIDVCWRAWIPLFSVLYRTNNYWNLPRLWRVLPRPHHRRRNLLNVLGLAAFYAALVAWLGPALALRLFGLAASLSLIFCDPILFSQHNHVPQRLSMGRPVKPHAPAEQGVFTRSLRFSWPVSTLVLLRFDAHELHHRHPHVPGYLLHRVPEPAHDEHPALDWILKARRVRASVLMFQNRDQTGLTL